MWLLTSSVNYGGAPGTSSDFLPGDITSYGVFVAQQSSIDEINLLTTAEHAVWSLQSLIWEYISTHVLNAAAVKMEITPSPDVMSQASTSLRRTPCWFKFVTLELPQCSMILPCFDFVSG